VKRGGQNSRREEKTGKVERTTLPKRWLVVPVIVVLVVGLIIAGIAAQINSSKTSVPPQHIASAKVEIPVLKTPHTLAELLALPPAELEHCDIAQMNLLCAESLPGAENLRVDESLATLDQWAQHIKSEIDRNFHHYSEDPAYFYNSSNFYKMAMIAVVLYEDYNIRYNPKWMAAPGTEQPDDHFYADSRDILIHGLLGDQRMGTCSSMPVLYIALGRRLGYPLKLVKAKGHLFMRWDTPTEKFDMDATGKGLNKYDDEEYKKWPFPLTEKDIQEEDYLKSLSPHEELSVFLSIRGFCQTDNGLFGDALASFSLANNLVPAWKESQVMLAHARQRLARPAMLVQQQQPMHLHIPDDPNPLQKSLQNPSQTP
jgi:hypothetical protein